MGIAISQENHLYYLIDEDGALNWLPHLVFTMIDNRLPSNWKFKCFGRQKNEPIFFLIGFEELLNNDFVDSLIERDYDSLVLYFKRKMELESESNLQTKKS